VNVVPARELIERVLKKGGYLIWPSSLAFLNTSNFSFAQSGMLAE